jgi:hypothetical protein
MLCTIDDLILSRNWDQDTTLAWSNRSTIVAYLLEVYLKPNLAKKFRVKWKGWPKA